MSSEQISGKFTQDMRNVPTQVVVTFNLQHFERINKHSDFWYNSKEKNGQKREIFAQHFIWDPTHWSDSLFNRNPNWINPNWINKKIYRLTLGFYFIFLSSVILCECYADRQTNRQTDWRLTETIWHIYENIKIPKKLKVFALSQMVSFIVDLFKFCIFFANISISRKPLGFKTILFNFLKRNVGKKQFRTNCIVIQFFRTHFVWMTDFYKNV